MTLAVGVETITEEKVLLVELATSEDVGANGIAAEFGEVEKWIGIGLTIICAKVLAEDDIEDVTDDETDEKDVETTAPVPVDALALVATSYWE